MIQKRTIILAAISILLFSEAGQAQPVQNGESGTAQAQSGVAQPAVVQPDRAGKKTRIKNEPSTQPVTELEKNFETKYKFSPKQKVVSFLTKKYKNHKGFPSLSRSRLLLLQGEEVEKLFQNRLMYVLRFMQWPVSVPVPDGLSSNNILVIDKKGKIETLVDEEDLKDFFAANLKGETVSEARSILSAWLWIAKEFAQDGMFQFRKIDQNSFSISENTDGLSASGKIAIAPRGGNEGEIRAILSFDKSGRLETAKMVKRLQAGIRPICQSHRLLDKDPVVRRMAEQDLLVMGSMCKAYLFEQRKTVSPALKKAIDDIWQKILEREGVQ